MLNLDQVLSAARWVLATGGAFAVSKGYLTQDSLQTYAGAIVSIIPFVWSMFVHSDASSK